MRRQIASNLEQLRTSQSTVNGLARKEIEARLKRQVKRAENAQNLIVIIYPITEKRMFQNKMARPLRKRFSIAVVSCQWSSSLLVHFPRVIAHLSRGSRFSSRSARWPPHDGVRRRGGTI